MHKNWINKLIYDTSHLKKCLPYQLQHFSNIILPISGIISKTYVGCCAACSRKLLKALKHIFMYLTSYRLQRRFKTRLQDIFKFKDILWSNIKDIRYTFWKHLKDNAFFKTRCVSNYLLAPRRLLDMGCEDAPDEVDGIIDISRIPPEAFPFTDGPNMWHKVRQYYTGST